MRRVAESVAAAMILWFGVDPFPSADLVRVAVGSRTAGLERMLERAGSAFGLLADVDVALGEGALEEEGPEVVERVAKSDGEHALVLQAAG
jgi:hypothetical protein